MAQSGKMLSCRSTAVDVQKASGPASPSLCSPRGLVGNTLSCDSGEWERTDAGVGAGVDSFYEYLLKASGGSNHWICWAITAQGFDARSLVRAWMMIRTNSELRSDPSVGASWPTLLLAPRSPAGLSCLWR